MASASVVAIAALAIAVAAAIKRAPPSFAGPPIATVRDASQQQALWSIRIAADAHQLAADALTAAPAPPPGRAYQLWLQTPVGPRTLGLLPTAGREVIPEIPAIAARLSSGAGEVLVSLEPARGSIAPGPSGPVLYRAPFRAGG